WGRGGVGVLFPGLLELGAIAVGAVAAEEFLVALDAGLDEIFRCLLEDRAALVGVGFEQRLAAPAVELRGKLPTEIDDVVEAVVEAVGAVGRMRMRGVAGDEHAADLISFGDRDAQIPEADIVEVAGKRQAG